MQTTRSTPEFCATLYWALEKAEKRAEKLHEKLNGAVERLPEDQIARYMALTAQGKEINFEKYEPPEN